MSVVKKGVWSPEYYFKHSATQFGHARALLENYNFQGNETILDIGCGDGKITAAMANLVPEGSVLGIDKDFEVLNFAHKKFRTPTKANLDFTVGDVTELDKLGEFDLIVSFSCLHFVSDQISALKNISKNLKEGGSIILMLYRKCHAQWNALDKTSKHDKWSSYFTNYTPGYYEYLPESYQILLNELGLNQFRSEFTPDEMVSYESVEALTSFIRGWLPHLNVLPSEYHDEFLDLFIKDYLNNLNITGERELKIPFVRLIVS